MNRRAFLAGMGLGGAVFALSPHFRSVFESGAAELLFCVGSYGAGDAGTLRLMRVQRDKARVLSTHPSERPAAIVRHPFRPLHLCRERCEPAIGISRVEPLKLSRSIQQPARSSLSGGSLSLFLQPSRDPWPYLPMGAVSSLRRLAAARITLCRSTKQGCRERLRPF